MNITRLLQTKFGEYELNLYLAGPNGFYNYGRNEDKSARHTQGLALLEHFKIIPQKENLPCCPRCQLPMRAGIDKSRILGWRIICAGGHVYQPTNNTFIEQALLKVIGADMIVWAIYSFLDGVPLKNFMKNTGVTSRTAVGWYRCIRDVMTKIAAHDYERIGGPNDVVEINQIKLFRKKYNCGSMVTWENVWVVGGVSRTTCRVFASVVPDRSAETLRELLVNHVDLRTHICTTNWAGYEKIDRAFRRGHTVVNQSTIFKDPCEDDLLWVPAGRFNEACLYRKWKGPPNENGFVPMRSHTMNIDRCWRELKQEIGNGKKMDYADDYVAEWVYRRNILAGIQGKAARFERFMDDVRRAFPGIALRPMQRDMEECDCHECHP